MATDATVALGDSLLAIQTVVSRNVPAIETAVVRVGSIAGGDSGSPNVMPSEIVVTGTARSYSPKIRDLVERRLGELGHAQAASFGCTAEVEYKRFCPPLITHPEQTAVSVAAAASLVGADQVDGVAEPSTGSEDFSFMLEARPGGIVFIGNGVAADGSFHNVRTPGFNFNDDIITLGVASWVRLVHAELGAA